MGCCHFGLKQCSFGHFICRYIFIYQLMQVVLWGTCFWVKHISKGLHQFILPASLMAQMVKNLPAMQETPVFFSWVWKFPWRRDQLLTPVFLGFSGGSDSSESTCNVVDLGSIPGLGRSPGGGHGNPLQYFCLENHHGQMILADYSP